MGDEALVVHQPGPSHGPRPGRERRHRIAGHADDGAVAQAQHRCVEPAEHVEAAPLTAGQLHRRPLRGLQHDLGHGDVDVLAPTRVLPLQEGGEDPDGRLQPRVEIGVRDGLGAGNVVQLARRELHETQLGVHHGRVRPPSGHGAILSVAGDRAVHDLRVAGAHLLVAEADAVEDAGPEVLEHDVASRCQIGHEVAARLGAEVHGDAALAAILLREVDGQTADARLCGSSEVALGRLDLDDVGPQIGECLAAGRAGEHTRQVEHSHTGERARVRHFGRP